MNHYDLLISRLDAFIRKYYANQLIRGSLLLLICGLFYVLAVSVGEYFLYMPVWLRLLFVSLFVVLGVFALVWLVIIPLVHMGRMGKVLSHEQAAAIIGRHFPEVSDKLLNILQLRRQSGQDASTELIRASIDQKAAQISVVPISRAVDLKANRRFLPYLIPLVIIGILIMVAAPQVLLDASERLLQPTKTFERPAPFRFVVQNEPLKAVRNQDYKLVVSVAGQALPTAMTLLLEGERLPMQPEGPNSFSYVFRNVTEDARFRLSAAGFDSRDYVLKVVQKPMLQGFKLNLDYPDYTGRADEQRSSLGDLQIPAGTRVSWELSAAHTDFALLRMGAGSAQRLPKNGTRFSFSQRFLRDTSYTVSLHNKESAAADSFQYQVQVIPDQYPVIAVQQFRDTITGRQILLTGTAGDDYAITRVLLHYQVSSAGGQQLHRNQVSLKISPGALTLFQQYFDVDMLKLQPGQKLTYYIEAWDNDGVQGPKAARSEVMAYHMFSPGQLDSAILSNARQVESGLSNSSKQSRNLQNELKDMQSRMLQSREMDWEQTQSLQELAQKQQQLKDQLDNTRKRFEEQVQQSQQKQYSPDLLEKQQQLKEQMDNLLNKELADQMQKLQELMQKLNKDQTFRALQEMEQQNKLFNMDMERMQELMKQLELQMRLEDMANKMDELAQKELNLREKTEKGQQDAPSLSREQQEIKDALDKAMQQDMKELEELNKKTQQPQQMDDAQEQAKEAGEQMQQSKESLEQGQKSKASENQSKAAQNLQQMAQMMREQAGGMSLQQIEMDIRAVRQILTNLIRLSFDQETLMNSVQRTATSSQTYLANQREQKRLHQNARMIRDSLFVLSKRLFQLAATVNKETTELERHLNGSVQSLEARRVSEAATRQQYAMTHTNNLALMLNEMLSNLMQMQSQAMSGQQGSCKMPGGMSPGKSGNPSPGKQLSDIITKQQQLGGKMQQMDGAQPGGKQGQKPGQQGQAGQQGQPGQQGGEGQQGGAGEYGNAEQLARMAEQQAAIRRQLQDLNRQLNSKGIGMSKELQELMQQMDRTETDLVNRRLGGELLRRQQEIMTRLLEAERSLREQEQDEQRSARSGQELSRPLPPELAQQLKERQELLDLYRTVPAGLKPYYRQMVESYYKMIGNK